MSSRKIILLSLTALLAFISLILPINNVMAQDAQNNESIQYYWGIGCPHCENVEPFLEDIGNKYPELNIEKIEIYQNQENAREFMQVLIDLEVLDYERGVPFLRYGDKYFVGDKPIIDNLENLILENKNNSATIEKEVKENKISFVAITMAALVDSINPCAIAVLIILLSALMLIRDKRRSLYSGSFFILGVYVAYLLLGIGLSYFFHISTTISNWIYLIIGVVAILIGLFNIKDFFWYGGGGFVTEIPRRWRPLMKKVIHSATSPLSAFFIGMVITSFELPCTGGPYFFVLGLLSKSAEWTTILPLLAYYNLIFILPLIIILGLIYFGYTNLKETSEWRNRNVRLFHLIAGIIMLGLGIWVLFL